MEWSADDVQQTVDADVLLICAAEIGIEEDSFTIWPSKLSLILFLTFKFCLFFFHVIVRMILNSVHVDSMYTNIHVLIAVL